MPVAIDASILSMRDGTLEVITENPLRLGQNVKYVTDVLKLTTRADIAAAVKVTTQSVSQVIVGSSKGMKPINLVRLARLIGISVEELVTEDVEHRPDLIARIRTHLSPTGKPALCVVSDMSPHPYGPRERLDALVRTLYDRFAAGKLDLDIIGLLEHALRLNKSMS